MKRPILYIVIPFCLGIAISRCITFPIACSIILSAAFLSLALLKSHRNIFSHIALYLAVFFFGMAVYQNSVILPAGHISGHAEDEPRKVLVRGVVIDDPITSPALYGKKKTTFVIKVQGLGKMGQSPPALSAAEGSGTVPIFPRNDGDYSWQAVTGLVKASVYSDKAASVAFGDELMLEGLLSKPHGLKNPGVFDYEEYLAIKDIYAILNVKEGLSIKKLGRRVNPVKETAYKLRHAIRELFDRHLEAPHSGFLNAIFIGDRSSLDAVLKDDFIKTGTVHILAISGLHVGLIAAIILASFGVLRVPRRTNLILTSLLLVLYSFMAGSSPPIIRAVIIFCIFTIGYLIERDSDMLNSLSFAALLVLLWNPRELFDPSFQLSFVSVAGIVVLTPRIDGILGVGSVKGRAITKKAARYLLKGVSVSIAAWLATWPFIAAYFNIISPVSVIANLVVIPLLSAVMALSSLFLVIGAVSNFFAGLIAPVLRLVNDALFLSNHGFSLLPLAYFRIAAPSIPHTILYYAAIAVLFGPNPLRSGRMKISKVRAGIIIILVLNLLIWKDAMHPARRDLKMTFLDVGQGDAIFIELPGSGSVMIDGGSGGEVDGVDAGKAIVAPYLWNRNIANIDILIVTHFHEDHLGGILYILKNFKVGRVIDNGTVPRYNRIYGEYLRTIREKGLAHLSVGDGDAIGPLDGVKFFVLNPRKHDIAVAAEGEGAADENDDSIILKLVYKNFSALFCGDATDKPSERLVNSYGGFLKSDVMKVPHHGGAFKKEEIAEKFFQAVHPKISIISAGRTGRYRTPSKKTLKVITDLNLISYVTRYDGAVIISSDGDTFKREIFKR